MTEETKQKMNQKFNDEQKKQHEKYKFISHRIPVEESHPLYKYAVETNIAGHLGQKSVQAVLLYLYDKLYGNMIDMETETFHHVRRFGKNNVDGNVAIVTIEKKQKILTPLERMVDSDTLSGKEKSMVKTLITDICDRDLNDTMSRFQSAKQTHDVRQEEKLKRQQKPKVSYTKYHVHEIGTNFGVTDISVMFAAEGVKAKVIKERIAKTNLPRIHRKLVELKKIKSHKTQKEINELFK